MMRLLHFHKHHSEAGEPVECVVLDESNDSDLELEAEYGQEGYDVDVYRVDVLFEWRASLPLGVVLVPKR